ncbi:MAG TPA: ABC transporter permease, partial [Vicinamibacterales bacterium]|nr:ABC transporter permease [Vicinamibacterales bacterium]
PAGRPQSAVGGRTALAAFVIKELRHILRDRQTLAILLLMPLVQVVLFGYALRSDVRDIRLAVVDPSPDAASLALRNRFVGTGRFRVVADAQSAGELEPLFRRGQADAALVIDPEFGSNLDRGLPAQLLLVTDASDPNTGTTMQAYVRAVITDYQADLRARGHAARIVPQTRMRFNPTLESVNLFVPGLIALVLTLVSALMTAISLSREKERGTLEILLVSPLRPRQIIVGKVLPYLLLAFANVLTALVAAWAVFRVPFRGSVLLLVAESLIYSIVSLALGVLIASRTPSQRAAMLGALLGTMLPNTLLSGMIFPIASMPGWLQPVTNVVPARWFIVIARGIMLKGVGLAHLWQETLILVLMMVVLLAVSVRSFKPRLA